MDEETRKHLAGLLAGTQVPLSMGMLGTAREHWVWFSERLGLMGWHDAESIDKKLIEAYGGPAQTL